MAPSKLWCLMDCQMERTVGFSRGRRKRNSWEMMSKAGEKIIEVEGRVGNKRMGQGVGQQGKGKGRSLIANSGGLVSAVTKTQGNKFSSRRNK
ncbi:hypothetical protein Bca4012_050018 [Brassica carinata]